MNVSSLIEMKALLTLALLKSGTSAKDIQTAVNVASAARLMAAEEFGKFSRNEQVRSQAKASNVRGLRQHEEMAYPSGPDHDQLESLNSDIKALLSLLLLQQGASSKEILTTLRMAAGVTEEEHVEPEEMIEEPVRREIERRPATSKQAVRNEPLPPISRWARAA
jgi:hypothetical protein